jgi:hypothetical protein
MASLLETMFPHDRVNRPVLTAEVVMSFNGCVLGDLA